MEYAKAHAPVDTGAYRDGLQIEEVKHAHRTACMVVGTDPKTLLVESRTGNLRKALKLASHDGSATTRPRNMAVRYLRGKLKHPTARFSCTFENRTITTAPIHSWSYVTMAAASPIACSSTAALVSPCVMAVALFQVIA